MTFSNRGIPEVIIPDAALKIYNNHAMWSLHLAACEVMNGYSIKDALVEMRMRKGTYREHFERTNRINRIIRKLFVDAKLAGKYDELVGKFTARLITR